MKPARCHWDAEAFCDLCDLPQAWCAHKPAEALRPRGVVLPTDDANVPQRPASGRFGASLTESSNVNRVIPGKRVIWPQPAEPDEIAEPVRLPTTWAPENAVGECRCGKPTRDDRWVCDDCADLLAKALGEVPWVLEQLDITMTRTKAANPGGGRSSESGLPWHERAAETKRSLHALLVNWVRWCDAQHVRSSDPRDGLPDDDSRALARWLLWRVDGLTLHATGPDAVEQVTDALADAHRLIRWKRKHRTFLGRCSEVIDPGEDQPLVICGGDIYADEGSDDAVCEQCGHTSKAEERREKLLGELADKLYTAAEIADLSTYLDLIDPPDKVRKLVQDRIRTWAKRKQLEKRDDNGDGEDPARYRFGDARALLEALDRKRRTEKEQTRVARQQRGA